MHLEIVKK